MADENGLLPSYKTACDLYEGDPAAVWKVGLGFLTRAAVIGLGIAIAGRRKNVARDALAGSAAVEAFVLYWVWANDPKAWKARYKDYDD